MNSVICYLLAKYKKIKFTYCKIKQKQLSNITSK